VLHVHSTEHGDGRILLRKGQIYFATIDESFDIRPRKAIYRICSPGSTAPSRSSPRRSRRAGEIQDTTRGAHGGDAADRRDPPHRRPAPARSARLVLPQPLQAPLRELKPVELDLLQSALNNAKVQAVLDKSAAEDLRR